MQALLQLLEEVGGHASQRGQQGWFLGNPGRWPSSGDAPHLWGLYQLKENKAPRLALALASLLKHLSPLPTRVYHSASRTDPSIAFSKTTLHFCKCNTKKMNEMLPKKFCIFVFIFTPSQLSVVDGQARP